jgi:uncharacterized protein
MPLLINLRELEEDIVELKGKLPAKDLDVDQVDELIKVTEPLKYDLTAQKLDQSILVQGDLSLTLNCECSRCLKPFLYDLELNDWACHLPLEGEDKVIVANDRIDLTPAVREDILLGFPQHPLCREDCSGLPKKTIAKLNKKTTGADVTKETGSTWAELNKLKF